MPTVATIDIKVGTRIKFEVESFKQSGVVEEIKDDFYIVRDDEDGQLYQWDRVREDKNDWGITDDQLYEIISA